MESHQSRHPKFIIVIPARIESQRLPRKLLLSDAGGIPVFEHTWRQAKKSRADAVYVATDSAEIFEWCMSSDKVINVVSTGSFHQNGTSRVCEAVKKLRDSGVEIDSDIDWIINLQADEPEMDPRDIDLLIDEITYHQKAIGIAQIFTAVSASVNDISNPSFVKAVLSNDSFIEQRSNRIIYFTRKYIDRSFKHVGVYAYRPRILEWLSSFYERPICNPDNLEQIAWLAHGRVIYGVLIKHHQQGIDVQEQYEAFVGRWHIKKQAKEIFSQ